MIEIPNEDRERGEGELELSNLLMEKLEFPQWSEKLLVCCEEQTEKIIKEILEGNEDVDSIIIAIIPFLIDLLFRKESVKMLLNKLKKCLKEKSKKLYEEIKSMEFSDFMLICDEKMKNPILFGFLQSEMGIPLQIYKESKEKGGSIYYNPYLLRDIIGFNKFSIIFHCSTKAAQKYDKINIIYKLWKFKEEYKYKKPKEFSPSSIFVHNLRENKLLLNYNGCIDEEENETLTEKIYENSTHLILHVEEEEIFNTETGTVDENFIKKISKKFPKAKKTILFVWNCSEENNESYEELNYSSIRFVCLKDEINDEDYELIKDLTKEFNFFQEQNEINFLDFLDDRKKEKNIEEIERREWEISNIISELPMDNNKISIIEEYFPHIYYTNKIKEEEREIEELKENLLKTNEEEKKKMYQKIIHKEEEKNKNEEKLKKVYLSKFVELIFNRIQSENELKMDSEIISQKLFEWKSKTIAPNLIQFVEITNKIKEEKNEEKKKILKEELKFVEKRIDECDISLTTILNEVIIKCEFNPDKKKSVLITPGEPNVKKIASVIKSPEEETINKIYRSSIEKMIPINLVEGKNLTFGNKYLKQLFVELSTLKKYENKKVYIVSIIGAQSSAKSTLLNYLFRSKFETSAGRCTKGMYFNICHCEDRVILVIDTEGLLSASSRDHQFDNRIATFVLSVSNLVILNHRGELNAQQRDLLYICMFAMKFLRMERNREAETPSESQRVFFVLRDQRMPKKDEKHQEQILSKFMEDFEDSQKENINYKEYFNLCSEDIFCFPNAIDNDQNKFGLFESYSEIFGSCVRGLRSQIMLALDNSKNFRPSLLDCYEHAEYYWNTILKCGSDLMNYKLKLELNSKLEIERKYEEISPKENINIEFEYEVIYNKYEKWKLFDLKHELKSTIQPTFESIRENWVTSFQTKLKELCLSICKDEEWLKVCYDKIDTKSWVIYNHYDRKVADLILSKQQEEEKRSLEDIMKQKIGEIINNFVNEETTLREFNLAKKNFLEIPNEEINLCQKECEILNLFKMCFREKTNENYQKSQELFQKSLIMGNMNTNYKEFLRKYYKISNKFFLDDESEEILFVLLREFLAQIEKNCRRNKKITNLIKMKELHKIKDIEKDFREIFIDSYNAIVRDLEGISKEYFFLKVSFHEISDPRIQELLKGGLIMSFIKYYFEIKYDEDEKKMAERIHIVTKYENKIKEALDSRGNDEKISKNWVKSIKEKLQKDIESNVMKQNEHQLKDLEKRFDAEKLINIALSSSFKKVESGKSKWIECFKFVANQEKYLFEIMCKDSLITRRADFINTVIDEQVGESVQEYHDLIYEIESLLNEKDKNIDEEKVKEIKDLYSLVSIEDKERLKEKNVTNLMQFNYLLKALKKENETITQSLREEVEFDILRQKATDFIEKDLKYTIIGCQSRCPLCKVKCTLSKGHYGDHRVFKNCHIMQSLGGIRYNKVDTPSYHMCMSEYDLEEGSYTRESEKDENGNAIYYPALEYIEKFFPEWYPYFKENKELKNYQTSFDHEAFKEVWANISEIIIKYKFTYMKDDKEFEDLKKDELNEEDLDKYTYTNVSGEDRPIRDYIIK